MTSRASPTAAWVVALALGGCSSSSAPPPLAFEPAPPPAPPPRASTAADPCGAADLAYLVGRSRADIPVPVDLTQRRVACTTCPLSLDYSPRRLTILFDAQSGVIKDVKCG